MAYIAQITLDDQNRRMDRILRKALPNLPLSAIHKMFRKGHVHIDGKPVSPSFKPQAGSLLEIHGPADEDIAKKAAAQPLMLTQHEYTPQKSPSLDILFENEALLFINKKAGIPVHGNRSLDEAVQGYLKTRLPQSLSFRSGPLHRLDQGTSGIITFSKSLLGAQRFSEALREHRLEKWYVTVFQGIISETVEWNDVLYRDKNQGISRIAREMEPGKEAHTTVYPLFHHRGAQNTATLVLIKLKTGRTHQIRAQAAAHGHPLLGDSRYGSPKQYNPWFLHAYALAGLDSLQLAIPETIQAPLKELQLSWLEKLFTEKDQEFFIKRLQKTPPLKDLLNAII